MEADIYKVRETHTVLFFDTEGRQPQKALRFMSSWLPGAVGSLDQLATWQSCNLTLLTLGFPYDSFSVQIISDSKERHPTDKNILVSLTKVPPFAPSVPAKYHVKVSWSHSQIFLQVLTCCLPTSWLWPRMSCTADLRILIRCRSLSWGRLLAY